jgi:hypothetical protein
LTFSLTFEPRLKLHIPDTPINQSDQAKLLDGIENGSPRTCHRGPKHRFPAFVYSKLSETGKSRATFDHWHIDLLDTNYIVTDQLRQGR